MSTYPPFELSCALRPFYDSFGVGPAILDIQSAHRCKLIGSLWSKADCARLAFQSAMIPSLSYGHGNKAAKRQACLLEAKMQDIRESLEGILERSKQRERQEYADRQHDLRTESRARHVRVG
jgi:hypothetical protein